jgi:hypothetical protein
MIRGIYLILLVTSAFLFPFAEIPSQSDRFPSVSVLLPASIPSENVQISYFLIGPFGGYRGYTKERRGLHSYEISASVEGKTASELRMIVYAPGCEIKTFVLPLTEDSKVEQAFECQPAATVHLSGQILLTELARERTPELVVDYMAYWAHGFFGITDGFVTKFRFATVSPDSNGAFQLELPYFSADVAASSSQKRASLWLTLRDSKNVNQIASTVQPEAQEFQAKDRNLRIESYYPDGLRFTCAF